MARACIFCGDNGPMTNEHIYGDWISKFFIEHYGNNLSGKVELVDSQGNIIDFNIPPFQHKAKLVCKKCNGGWMSNLEGEVGDILKPMLLGKSKMLRANAQRCLAFWCAKTALVIDRMQSQVRVVPDSHYLELFNRQSALPAQVILVAYRSLTYNGSDGLLGGGIMQLVSTFTQPANWTQADSERLERHILNGRKLYKITFFVGNFVALVFGHDLPMQINVQTSNPIAKHIWPMNQRLRWSDDLSVDKIGGVVGFHMGFASNPEREQSLPPALMRGYVQQYPS